MHSKHNLIRNEKCSLLVSLRDDIYNRIRPMSLCKTRIVIQNCFGTSDYFILVDNKRILLIIDSMCMNLCISGYFLSVIRPIPFIFFRRLQIFTKSVRTSVRKYHYCFVWKFELINPSVFGYKFDKFIVMMQQNLMPII